MKMKIDTNSRAIQGRKDRRMSDLISRKGVFIPDITVEMFRNASLESIEDLMASGEMEDILLPSAQPERKKGKWIYGEDEYGIDGYHCDKCGFFVPWDYTHTFINYIEDYNFCPNCGADMRGEQDG